MEQKIIYFDQNAWIYLAQSFFGENTDPELKVVVDTLMEKVNAGELIVPLSMTHAFETLKHRNTISRERLVNFMMDISKGYTLQPYTSIIDAEVEQAINKRLNLPKIDMKAVVLKEGLPNLFGTEGMFTGGTLIQRQTAIRLLHSPALLKWSLLNEDLARFESTWDINGELVGTLEILRQESLKVKDKKRREDVATVKQIGSLIPRVSDILQNKNLEPIDILKMGQTREEITSFLKDVPSAYVSLVLTHERDKQLHRPIKPNDMNDIASLSVAIPYCDIVVAENMFGSIARNKKLDNLYSTKIISSVKDLKNYF